MRKILRLSLLIILISLAFSAANLLAQVPLPPPPPPPPPVSSGSGIGTSRAAKKPGATVRGRLVYEDTGAPIRFAEIGVAPAGSLGYYRETVQTNYDGEFILKDLAPGAYYPFVKDRVVLNPEVFYSPGENKEVLTKTLDLNFQKLVIEGLGDYQYSVRARRGASISGTVRYSDGEPAVRVDVELMQIERGEPVKTGFPGPQNLALEKTDDIGYYRFSGLPEGRYFVRVEEKVPHSNAAINNEGGTNFDPRVRGIRGDGLLNTWYPDSPSPARAVPVTVFYGPVTEGINITLPERRLYDVSGIVIRKKTRQPLENFRVIASPLPEEADDAGTARAATRMMATSRSSYISSQEANISAEWSIINLPKGKYLLTASPVRVWGGVDFSDPERTDWPKYPAVSKEIELNGENLENVVFEIPEAASITGVAVADEGAELPTTLSLSR